MSTMKKTKRQIKEMKQYFPGLPQLAIKEEICTIILSKITGYLLDMGKVIIKLIIKLNYLIIKLTLM
jgi:hypothetical protein